MGRHPYIFSWRSWFFFVWASTSSTMSAKGGITGQRSVTTWAFNEPQNENDNISVPLLNWSSVNCTLILHIMDSTGKLILFSWIISSPSLSWISISFSRSYFETQESVIFWCRLVSSDFREEAWGRVSYLVEFQVDQQYQSSWKTFIISKCRGQSL